jgi:hypothetical protein
LEFVFLSSSTCRVLLLLVAFFFLLFLCVDLPIYGKISNMTFYRPSNSDQDWLFVATEKLTYFVLSFDEAKQEVITQVRNYVLHITGIEIYHYEPMRIV